MITKYNIAKAQTYMKDGVEKTYWATVGTMTEFTKQDGSVSKMIEIPAIGLKASVFEQRPRNTQNTSRTAAPAKTINYDAPEDLNSPDIELPPREEDINMNDIPFD